MMSSAPERNVQRVNVLLADDLRVVSGANHGDGLTDASELILDDVYTLLPQSERPSLAIVRDDDGFRVGAGSEIGTPGAALYFDCLVTFMSPDGATIEALVIAEVEDGALAALYAMPFAEMASKQDYALVGIDTETAPLRFAALTAVSFTAGTHITLSTGAQRAVEDLAVGDVVLTRGNGAQPIRWIGRQITRAVGAFAPILIKEGVLNNARDLYVSPNHRLFVYQREDRLALGRSEVLIKAKHLVNGGSVVRTDGGFVEYHQLVFDAHEIIYAEGIATESLMVDTRNEPAVPEAVRKMLDDHSTASHLDYEVRAQTLDAASAADALKRASLG